VDSDPHYLAVVPGAKSQLSVPLRNKGLVIGALNLLSEKRANFTERDEWILRQFGAHVAQAIATARLFESEREYAETLETLAEIGREMSAILDPDELLTRLAHLIKRVIDYRIFGIALVNEEEQTLELKVTIKFRRRSAGDGAGEDGRRPGRLRRAPQGSSARPDVTKDPRYIDAVPGVRSELVVPLLLKDRCIGVFDLESPEVNAFNKKHVKLLTLLASEAAVAIENARLVDAIKTKRRRASRRSCGSLSASRWRCCLRSCRSGCAAWMWRGISIRRASLAAICATSSRPSRTCWWSRWATCLARACRRRSIARRSAKWCAADVSAGAWRSNPARRRECWPA
jgi:GAF domain-containing protein